jgi:hypothetical protein
MDENLGDGRMEPVALYTSVCVTDIRGVGDEYGGCIVYLVSDTHTYTHTHTHTHTHIYIYKVHPRIGHEGPEGVEI